MGKKKKPASKKGGANKKGKSDDIGVDNVETNDGDEDTATSDDVLEKKSKTAAKVPFIYYVSTYCTKLNVTTYFFL